MNPWIIWITAITGFLSGGGTVWLAWLETRKRAIKRAKRARAAHPPNLFFSMQMNDLSEEKYQAVRKGILGVVAAAKALNRLGHIYFFNQDVPTHEALDKQHFPIDEYMRELDKCDYFIAIISKRVHSSIYFEAGYAFAKGKECILFSATDDVLPTITKCCCDTYRECKAIPFSDFDDLIHKLSQMIPHFHENYGKA